MTIYYKATDPDGKDFYSGTVDYAGALESGNRVRVRTETRKTYSCCSGDVLHASDVPTETLVGGRWPCRLFEVSGRPVAQEGHKYGFRSLKVEREIEAHLTLGPQGREIADLINRCLGITYPEARNLGAARGAAWGAAWGAARDAAWGAAGGAAGGAARGAARDAARGAARDAALDAAWGAAWGAARDAAGGAARGAARDAALDAAWGAAWDAASALVVRDRLEPRHYDTLTGPWRRVIGPLHADDVDLR